MHTNWRRFIMVDSPYHWITVEVMQRRNRGEYFSSAVISRPELLTCRERPRSRAPRSVMSSRRLMGLPKGRGSRIKYSRSGDVHRSESGHLMSAMGVLHPDRLDS